MNFEVYCGKKLIALFLYEIDTDNFIDDMEDRYPDEVFTKKVKDR